MSESAESVTIVSQVFHPDTSANSGITTELAVGLASRGLDVTVLTAQPSYSSEDRQSVEPWWEQYEGVQIYRLPATRFDRNQSIAHRMSNEMSFFISALIFLFVRRLTGGEILLLPTAPTFLPTSAWLLQMLGYDCIPIVMDLYPDMAVELEYLKAEDPVFRLWDCLNLRAYRNASHIVTIGDTMKTTLHKKYGQQCDVTVIHNWADGDLIQPQPKQENPFVHEHDLFDEMTVLYSGNLGQHHDIKSIIEAATKLTEESLPVHPHFLFIGEGGKKEQLQSMVSRRNLDRISFLPYQPTEALPDSLTAGDIAVVTMEEGVEGLCVSSKFYTALASGTAILAISSEDAEIGSVVERTNCGIRVDPNSPSDIADALRYWAASPVAVDEMGKRARTVFDDEFSKKAAIDAYECVLKCSVE